MAEIVRMPKLSDTMTEGVVAKWHKKVGDKVKSGELLAEIETDKATMDFESFFDETFYSQKEYKVKTSIGHFFTDLFNYKKTFTKSDLDMITAIYKVLDKHLKH